MAVTVASWIGLTVSAQRDVSPNRSCSRSASDAVYRRRCGSIRIWQRSAIAWIRTPDRSVMVSWKDRVGVAANRSAVAPVHPKIRSATLAPPLQDDRPVPQPGQELIQCLAGLGPAVEPLPVHPELADQRVAHVDRDQEHLVLMHEDGLGVGRQLTQQRVFGSEPVPGFQVELALGHPARARVARHHPAQGRVEEEERHRDRDLQLVPVGAGQRPGRVVADPLGHRLVPAPGRALVGEQQVARPAGAGDRALVHVDQVPVPAVQDRLAHLAPFGPRRVVPPLAAQLHRQPARHLRAARPRTGRRGPGWPFDETAQPGSPGGSRSAPSWSEALGGILRHRAPSKGRLVICSSVGSAGGWAISMATPAASGAAPATAFSIRSRTVSAEQPLCSRRSRSTPASSRPRYSTLPACEPSWGSTSSTARRTRALVSSGCRSCTSSRLSTSGSATSLSISFGPGPSPSSSPTISVILASPAPYSSTRQPTSSSAVAATCGPARDRSSASSASTRSPAAWASSPAAIGPPCSRVWFPAHLRDAVTALGRRAGRYMARVTPVGECAVLSTLPPPRYMCTPHGRHGSKLRTARMMSMPLKFSLEFSSKIGVFCTASSYGPGVP